MARKKIVVIPGVGFHIEKEVHQKLIGKLATDTGCEVEYYLWEHSLQNPKVDKPLKYCGIRNFLGEVILDFQQVISHVYEMPIPEADYYIGHSAGSILALSKEDKNCIIMGSPAILTELLHYQIRNRRGKKFEENGFLQRSLSSKARRILNIVNLYDPLSYPINSQTENFIFKPRWYQLSAKIPPFSHTCYWNNEMIINKIVETINAWKEEDDKMDEK